MSWTYETINYIVVNAFFVGITEDTSPSKAGHRSRTEI